jgi:hypothetical protein
MNYKLIKNCHVENVVLGKGFNFGMTSFVFAFTPWYWYFSYICYDNERELQRGLYFETPSEQNLLPKALQEYLLFL